MLFRCSSQHQGQLEKRQRKPWKRLGVFGAGDRQLHEVAAFERVESFVHSTVTQLGEGAPSRYWLHHDEKVSNFMGVQLTLEEHKMVVIENIMAERHTITEALAIVGPSIGHLEREHALNRAAAVHRNQCATFNRVTAVSVHRQSRRMGAPAMARELTRKLPDSTAIVTSAPTGGSWLERFSNYKKQMPAEWVHMLEWIQKRLFDNPHFDAITVPSWAC